MTGDNKLWRCILDFDLDEPISEYGFSTRLAKENYWTMDFTAKAILEYKKFMYLAATSDMMVSPSEVVDVVWHQHLVFTQSYAEFCVVLGKLIQHVPSTHNRTEAEKFRLAKERTQKLYQEVFGDQPAEVWLYQDMFASLGLPKAKFKIRTIILLAILVFVLAVIPGFFILRSFYLTIQNPDFIQVYLCISLSVFALLGLYNRFYLRRIVQSFPDHSFIKHLHPLEALYLQTGTVSKVMHSVFNRYVSDQKIIVHKDKSLEWTGPSIPTSAEEFVMIDTFERVKSRNYFDLSHQASTRPFFTNISYSMDAFKKYFCKSTAFGKLFQLNLFVVALLLLISFERLILGIIREKPVDFIAMASALTLIISIAFLHWLMQSIAKVVSEYYRSRYKPSVMSASLDWQYLILGSAVLMPAFLPSVNDATDKSTWGSNDSSTGSGSDSCGSSCSSCGGCGGGD